MVRRCLPIVFCGLAVACPSGSIVTGGDDADDPGTPDSDQPDLCATIVCPADQTCVGGRCLTDDLCAGVVCSNLGEACDPRDGACHAGATDADGDGVTLGEGDCDDGNATIMPGAVELCDGVDQDCDFEVDDGFVDGDGDGFDTCGFGDPAQADCDDTNAAVAPGLAETCDGVDNDCDGTVDDGIAERPCVTACGSGTERCEGGAWACSAPATCECTPAGAEQSEACGFCGTRRRTCGADLRWSSWGACAGGGDCLPGSTESRGCGDCGDQSRTCSGSCTWGSWSSCSGEGVCSPGDSDSQNCGDCGTRSRTCSASCAWGSWSSCHGTRGCSTGFQCQSDGSCECGPFPEWDDRKGPCQPSCGGWLRTNGYSDEGAGCCSSGCLGAGAYGTSWDCNYCCESPPGCW